MADPYAEGHQARLDDRSYNENPYTSDTEEFEDWRGGWHDADVEIEEDEKEA